MDISIFLLLNEMRMTLEIEFFRMFKDEICSRMKNILGEHLVRNSRQVLQGIWRICKNDIELFMTDLKELENIMTDNRKIVHSEFRGLRLYEVRMKREHLDAIDHRSSTRCKLI